MYKPLGLMILIFLTMGTVAHAASTAELVSKGNSLYLAGKYDEALSAYEEASVKAPESPRLYFNKGAAYYRKENYDKAKEAFENAALKTKDVNLEAMARFNLGNCSFSQAQRQKDSDLNEMLEACQTAIRHYQEALKLDPGLKEAAENIEVVRLVMKNIMDEINKRKEAAEKNQATQEKMKNQKTALDELNRALSSLSGDNGQQERQASQKREDSNKDKGQNDDRNNAQKDQGQTQKQKKEAAQRRQNEPGKQDGAEKEMQQQPLMTQEDARSILDEEKENLQQRRASASGGYSDVDRDW
jgi:Ca-activated chloride channel homolog